MIKYSLKEVFFNKKRRNILYEMGIITQGDFALRLTNVLERKPSLEINPSPLAQIIINTAKKEHISAKSKRKDAYAKYLRDKKTTTKDDKKLKKSLSSKLKSAEAAIHEEIIKQNIKNNDGVVVDFMKMRPLYESLLDYLETAGDVNIDDCIKAADYYMRNFYRIATESDKDQIDRGNFDFSIVFERTNYFQDYLEDSLPSKIMGVETRNDIIKLYEDSNVEVVFPLTNPAFLSYISSKNGNVDWCTRSPRTWISYNRRFLVAIAHDKTVAKGDRSYLISLKINFDGQINYDETCDYPNNHMNEESVKDVIPEVGEDEIRKVVVENDLRIKGVPENIEKHLNNLAQLNNIEEIKKLFYQIVATAGLEEDGEEFFGFLYKSFNDIHDDNKALELYQEVMFTVATEQSFLQSNEDLINTTNMDLAFYDFGKKWQDFRQDYLDFALSKKIRRKSICLNFFLEEMLYQKQQDTNFSIDDLNRLIEAGLKEKNITLFKRIISNLIKYLEKASSDTVSQLEKNFSTILSSRAFKSYFSEAKDDMFSYKRATDGFDLEHVIKLHSQTRSIDSFMTYLTTKNKTTFLEENIETFEEMEISPEMLDYKIIRDFINKNLSDDYIDLQTSEGIEKINSFNYPSLVLQKEDVVNIIKNIYRDFNTFREIAQDDILFTKNFLSGIALKHRRNKDVIKLLEGKDDIVKFCINQSIDIIKGESSSSKLYYIIKLISYIFLGEDYKFNSLDDLTKNNIVEIVSKRYDGTGALFGNDLPRYASVKRNFGQELNDNAEILRQSSSNDYNFFKQMIEMSSIPDITKFNIMSTFLFNFLSIQDRLSKSNSQLMHNFANLFKGKNVVEKYIDAIASTDNAFSPFLAAIAIINLNAPFINNSYFQRIVNLYLQDLAFSKVEEHLNDCSNYHNVSTYLYQDLNKHIVEQQLFNNQKFYIYTHKLYTKLFSSKSNINDNLFSNLVLSSIEKNSSNNTGLNKQILEKIIRDPKINNLDVDEIKIILTNFTLYGEDGDGLSLEERVQIRKLYLDMFKRESHLKKHSDFALELARQTDKVTQKHLAMVFPSAKDLMEKILKQYIRMLLS